MANEMKTKSRLKCWKTKSEDRKRKIERRNREMKYENEIGSKGERFRYLKRWRRMCSGGGGRWRVENGASPLRHNHDKGKHCTLRRDTTTTKESKAALHLRQLCF